MIEKNTERYLSFETELDEIQRHIKELVQKTDMNLMGRMINELEQIPNVIQNISLIPVVSQQITQLNDRISNMDKKLESQSKRISKN